MDGGVTKDAGVNFDVGDDENNKGEGDCGDDLFFCRFWAEKPAFLDSSQNWQFTVLCILM